MTDLPERQRSDFEVAVVATRNPGEVCVRLRGELDTTTVPVLRDRLADIKCRGGTVIVDLSDLSFIDSTGLHLMLELAAEATRDGWTLCLIPGPRAVQCVFQLTGVDERLPFRSPATNGKALEPA